MILKVGIVVIWFRYKKIISLVRFVLFWRVEEGKIIIVYFFRKSVFIKIFKLVVKYLVRYSW